MKPLVLIIEHRHCSCGMEFLAPNLKAMMWRELANLRNANILLPSHTYSNLREIVHVHTDIEYCPECFKTINGRQLELFPQDELPQLTFSDGKLNIVKDKLKPVSKYGLNYF